MQQHLSRYGAMTILAAVRTGAAFILAADSKLTTQAPGGKDSAGNPLWLPQTYDHAIKITSDATKTAIAAFAGNGSIGEQNATDYFSRVCAHLHRPPNEQDVRLGAITSEMVQARGALATKIGVTADKLPPTIAILAAPPDQGVAPRVWRIELGPDGSTVNEILRSPGVWFEGSVNAMMSLMYGILPGFDDGIRSSPGVDEAAFDEALKANLFRCPISQINFWTMPVQDAMDFASFAVNVQIEMERFGPGIPSCGGPIDIMVLEMAPAPLIRHFPGKTLHHPIAR